MINNDFYHRLKKICLITTGHIASDPRLVKEAASLIKAGFDVHIVFTQYVAPLIAYDRDLLAVHPNLSFDVLDWTKRTIRSRTVRFISGLKQKLAKTQLTKINRNYYWQTKKAIAIKADLYIAHNLGALPVAIKASKVNGAKCGFDAEDFHRHEYSNDPLDEAVRLKTSIEDTYIPQLDYMTAASPMIADRYTALYHIPVQPILNVFPKTTLQVSVNETGPLKLFWFSQTIGGHRGLESVLEAAALVNIRMELHLLGNPDHHFKNTLEQLLPKNAEFRLIYHGTIRPDDIFNLAGEFDIGLATELSVPLNRDICLTNKIFTYIQCGLVVVASATSAQRELLQNFPGAGHVYKDPIALANILTDYHLNRKILQETKEKNYLVGQQTLKWENEEIRFLKVIDACINPMNVS
ncbi:MAG: glycosyltransferase family 4 protein [Mucilaginibacter sp.]|nr:glycosyltransferase family 4 protein [Mucilaginibacter sp.]